MITRETVLERILLKIDSALDYRNYKDVEILANAYGSLKGDK